MPIEFKYDSNDFTLLEIITNGIVINQGNNDSIVCEFYFSGFTLSDLINHNCLINFTRPDGSSSNNVATSPDFDKLCYKLILSDWISEIDGTLEITAKIFHPDADTEDIYGIATQEIIPSAEQSLSTIEDWQYQALLDQLSILQSELEQNKFIVTASEDIYKGDPLMLIGSVGASGKMLVARSDKTLFNVSPQLVIGVATENIAKNAEGIMQTKGIIDKLNTSIYEEGDILYVDPAVIGGMTNVSPITPDARIPIAAVLTKNSVNGRIIVRPTYFPKLSQVQEMQLEDLETTPNAFLKYYPAEKVWKPTTISQDTNAVIDEIFDIDNEPTDENISVWFKKV